MTAGLDEGFSSDDPPRVTNASDAPNESAASAASAGSAGPTAGVPVVRHVFEYCTLRAVPRVERGDVVNVGVIVYCQARDFLQARTHVAADLVLALDAEADIAGIEAAVAAYACVCRGGKEAGQAGTTTVGQRFRWLTAPRSTVVQPGPVHLGLTTDPAADLVHLAARLLPAPGRTI